MQANGSVEILSCDWAVYRWWPCHDQSSALFAGESGTQQTPGHPHGGGWGRPYDLLFNLLHILGSRPYDLLFNLLHILGSLLVSKQP